MPISNNYFVAHVVVPSALVFVLIIGVVGILLGLGLISRNESLLRLLDRHRETDLPKPGKSSARLAERQARATTGGEHDYPGGIIRHPAPASHPHHQPRPPT